MDVCTGCELVVHYQALPAQREHRRISLMQTLNKLMIHAAPSNGNASCFRELLVVAICAMLSDNDTFEEMVAWARYKQDGCMRFLKLANGILRRHLHPRIPHARPKTVRAGVP